MRLLVKIGGAQLEQAAPRARLCGAIAKARAGGHEVVLVHGGGNQIRELGKALGIEDRYHEGLRITDARTAEVVLMVLGGQVNRRLCASLQRAGVSAVGISGADGGSFTARRLQRPGVELGFVGAIDSVQPALVDTLLAAGHVPTIATVAPGAHAEEGEPFYNLNADHAAGPLCRALRCDALLFLTDVPGVMDAQRLVLPALSPADCERLVQSGVAKGGMLPKLEAALLAQRENQTALIKIVPADGDDAVLAGLSPTIGTRFVADRDAENNSHG